MDKRPNTTPMILAPRATACEPGLMCMTSALPIECDPDAGCCLPLCDLSAPNACPGADLVCSAWYEEAMAPPGNENVGVCRMPD